MHIKMFSFLHLFINGSVFAFSLYACTILSMKTKSIKYKFTDLYKPHTQTQKQYVECLNDESKKIVVTVGPAGSGKTMFCCLKAMELLKKGEINKIIVTRPTVSVDGEEVGFLPGSIVGKMDPWTRPIFDVFLECLSKSELDELIYNNVIEISPLGFMRGRTFKNAFIIADEMQNSSPNQMKMLTTRLGNGSRMVITGDLNQVDKANNVNGLVDFMKLVTTNQQTSFTCDEIYNPIEIIEFAKEDIERSDIVKHVISLYEVDLVASASIEKVPRKIWEDYRNPL